MENSIEFVDLDGFIQVWYENDVSPFEDRIMGAIRKDEEGYHRFRPVNGIDMTCRMLRVVSVELDRLNT